SEPSNSGWSRFVSSTPARVSPPFEGVTPPTSPARPSFLLARVVSDADGPDPRMSSVPGPAPYHSGEPAHLGEEGLGVGDPAGHGGRVAGAEDERRLGDEADVLGVGLGEVQGA